MSLMQPNWKSLVYAREDESEIQAVAERIDASNPDTVYQFGRDVAENTAAYADSLLEQIRNKDLDDAGSKLTEVVNRPAA